MPTWSSVRSDSAHHCVLWISEWPRSLVYPGFLARVLLSSGVRRTFTLLYTPMRVLRTTGLIAVSARDPDELERAVAGIEQAAIQASCETRRLWGQQAQAFSAAALPRCRSA